MKNGTLVYVMGASGAGKDSLLQYARQQLDGHPGVVFAHRYITRPPEAAGENHVALSLAEFQLRLAKGLFVLNWESHHLCYGIGIEVRTWLNAGLTVVVNGSREYLPEARRRIPGLCPVLIEVDRNILRDRLVKRGRETEAAIDERLQRAAALSAIDLPGLVRIPNNTTVQEAGDQFTAYLTGQFD